MSNGGVGSGVNQNTNNNPSLALSNEGRQVLASLITNKDLDIPMLDHIVTQFMENGDTEMKIISEAYFAHDSTWQRVDMIMESSSSDITRVLALNCLSSTIKTRWNQLGDEDCAGIKDFVVDQVIKYSSEEKLPDSQRKILQAFDVCLINIVKYEWPVKWPKFITEIVDASKSSQSVCSNNMYILRLLSEEVFDYGRSQMVSSKVTKLKQVLNADFNHIFELCNYILRKSENPWLLRSTLQTLRVYLRWIPVEYIFETSIVELLASTFFVHDAFRQDAINCLNEIVVLQIPDKPQYDEQFVATFVAVIGHLDSAFGDADLTEIFLTGTPESEEFLKSMVVFITDFLRPHLSLVENASAESRDALIIALGFLFRVMVIPHEYAQSMFSMCIDFWNHFLAKLYESEVRSIQSAGVLYSRPRNASERLGFYQETLITLRQVCIACMARPEEVLVVQNEDGTVTREVLEDSDAIQLYLSMRETLIFLTNFDAETTTNLMTNQLASIVAHTEWIPNDLNRVCWAIGSISRALSETQEKDFLVHIIKDLLRLVQRWQRTEQKAIIAANIMYVVGQYPRFLRRHWTFLETVVRKLFEFMKEKHPGVQDMSCDTFLKIALKCRKTFLVQGPDGRPPLIEWMLTQVAPNAAVLSPALRLTFYKSLAHVIDVETEGDVKQELIRRLMELPNATWVEIMIKAESNLNFLWEQETVNAIDQVLKTNSAVCSALKSSFGVQLARIYVEMLQIYQLYSEALTSKISEIGAEAASRSATIVKLRTVKREVLKLVTTFVETASVRDHPILLQNYYPELTNAVLSDYLNSVPAARDPEALEVFTAFIFQVKHAMIERLPEVMEALFVPTFEMLSSNEQDWPDHQVPFYKFLEAVTKHCFSALLAINADNFAMVFEAICGAVRNLQQNVQEIGLATLQDMVTNFLNSEVGNDFAISYYPGILGLVLDVLTDTFHVGAIPSLANILSLMIRSLNQRQITVPLWENVNADGQQQQYESNSQFFAETMVGMILTHFETVGPSQVERFVSNLFASANNPANFRQILRDFLIELREYSAEAPEGSVASIVGSRASGPSGDGQGPQDLEELDRLERKKAADAEYKASVPGLVYIAPDVARTEAGLIDEDNEDVVATNDLADALVDD